MISDGARYYGAVLAYIVECRGEPVSISRAFDDAPGFYLIDSALPLYVKYSTQRHSPWSFTFQRAHQERQEALFARHGECLTAFVCGRDGIVALAHQDFRKVLDNTFEQQESVTIRRRFSEMYRVRGRDGSLERCVSRSSLAELLQRPAS